MPDDFRRLVVAALDTVGPGEVISYGDLAAEAGYPGAARGVGAVMAGSRPDEGLAWWRVVYSDGRLAPGHEVDQARRLRAEGVEVDGGRVVGGSPPHGGDLPVRSSRGASTPGRRR